MTEKKEHWKAKEKREREEAEALPVLDLSDVRVADNETGEERKLTIGLIGRPFHVFNARADLVAYCNTEEEADETLKSFVGGWKKMI